MKQKTTESVIMNQLPVFSLICGVFALTSFFYPPMQLILGASAVILAYLSISQRPVKPMAVAGIVIGSLAILISLIFFFIYMWTMQYMSDPANAGTVKEILKQSEEMMNALMPTQPVN